MTVKRIGSNQTEITKMINGHPVTFLYSYSTPVAFKLVQPDGRITAFRTSSRFSVTTTRHVNKWLASLPSEDIAKTDQAYVEKLANS